MPSQRISVRVPAGIIKSLKERSRITGARESDVVREALEKHLSQDAAPPSAYDRAMEAGLIGIVRNGKKDLSTNKKYFQGFGRRK
jgi:metal-responsive CopG/Arc/MetJ family transcriptional regulator